MTEPKNVYRSQWDKYADTFNDRPSNSDFAWPGDEWGNEDYWAKVFKGMFLDFGAANWKHCVEIGAGSGKYTKMVLDASKSDIIAFDISPAYQKVMVERLADFIEAGRVVPVIIAGKKPSELFDYINSKKLVRELDAFFAIDAMVHVDLQYLAAYFLTAALTLRQGGHLVMTLANAASTSGFHHLLLGVKRWYAHQGEPTPKFEWLSPEIVSSVLRNMGFEVTFVPLANLATARDLYVVAKLVDTSRADALRDSLL